MKKRVSWTTTRDMVPKGGGGGRAVVWPGRGGLVPRGLPRMVCKCKLARGSRRASVGRGEAVVLWEAPAPSTLKADGIFGFEDPYYTVCRRMGGCLLSSRQGGGREGENERRVR